MWSVACVCCVVWCGVVWHVENLRVQIQIVPVCASTTRTCVSTCVRGARTHGDVLNVHTERFQRTHGVLLPLPTHTNTHTTLTQHHTETDRLTERRERQRETETETERGKGDEIGERRDDERRKGRRKSEKDKKKNSVLTCTRVACACRRHSFCSFSLIKKPQSRTLTFHDVCFFSKPLTFHNGVMSFCFS